jgi:hypothetical protein
MCAQLAANSPLPCSDKVKATVCDPNPDMVWGFGFRWNVLVNLAGD